MDRIPGSTILNPITYFSTGIRSYVVSFFFLMLIPAIVISQTKFSVNGLVKDASSGETLIGATVRVVELNKGSVTNSYGFYSLSVPSGSYSLEVRYTGYKTTVLPILVEKNQVLNIELSPDNQLQEVVVTGRESRERLNSSQMSVDRLNMENVKSVPVLLGEKDILKTIQLLPGIKAAGEGNSGFYVRGGAADQNLILLDEANVYNASHLLGFFSTFNSDAIKDVAVYKGGMPAQYGGRLSSVLDIRMNEGNKKELTAEGGIGLIASRLKLEAPLVKDKSSFMIAGRRTYADLFLKLSQDTTLKSTSLYFYDLNAKGNYKLDEKNTLFVSGYFGKDVLALSENFSLNWGNTTATLRLNHLFNSRIFSNTTLIYSDYNYAIENLEKRSDFRVTSIIRDWNLKQDYQYFGPDSHILRFGMNLNVHKIEPGKITSSQSSEINSKTISRRRGAELSGYISDEWKLGPDFDLNSGIRLSSFSLFGPGNFYSYTAEGDVNGLRTYSTASIVKAYFNIEPRLSASYRMGGNSAIKASFTRNTQNLHLLSNSTSALPTDLWVMSSNNVKPEIANQTALGFYKNFKEDNYEFSAEVYYKSMQNQIDYRNAAELRANENVESELLYGKGRAYGLELFLKKRYGDFNGWLGYTLSRTERTFAGIDQAKWFPAKQDRTHDVSAVMIYKAGRRLILSGTFVYNTGNAVTFPAGKYQLEGQTRFYYTERNGYRMPDYHRLDLAATIESAAKKRFQSSWTFSVYNAYNRHNAYVIEFQDNPDDDTRTQAVQTALFGIIPSFTWNFKF